MNIDNTEASKPWYKYWAVWLILVLPLTAIVASGVTVYIAIIYKQAPPDSGYYKDGLGQKEITQMSEKSKQMKLTASLLIDANFGEVILNQNLKDSSLLIKFQHPILEEKDFDIKAVKKTDSTYLFKLPITAKEFTKNDWIVFISSKESHWQLKARLYKGESEQTFEFEKSK